MSNRYPTRLERKVDRLSRKLTDLQVRQWSASAKPQKRSALKALGSRLAAPLVLVDRAWYDARTIAGNQRAARDPRNASPLEFVPAAEPSGEAQQSDTRRIEALAQAAPAGPCPGCTGQPDRCSSFLPQERWCGEVLVAALREELECPLSTDLGVAWQKRLEEQDELEWSPNEPPVLSELCQDALTLSFCWLLSSWSWIASASMKCTSPVSANADAA